MKPYFAQAATRKSAQHPRAKPQKAG